MESLYQTCLDQSIYKTKRRYYGLKLFWDMEGPVASAYSEQKPLSVSARKIRSCRRVQKLLNKELEVTQNVTYEANLKEDTP